MRGRHSRSCNETYNTSEGNYECEGCVPDPPVRRGAPKCECASGAPHRLDCQSRFSPGPSEHDSDGQGMAGGSGRDRFAEKVRKIGGAEAKRRIEAFVACNCTDDGDGRSCPAHAPDAEPPFERAHTPGPWTAEPEEFGDGVTMAYMPPTIVAGDTLIATVRVGLAEEQANARLIAAAPDLLVVVRHLPWELFGTGHPLLDLAQAALAKAKGR